MNIKELANFTGKNKSTIGRWVAKCNSDVFDERLQNATNENPADFDIDEIEEILTAGTMSKDAVSILMQSARNQPPTTQVVDYEIIGKMIGMAVSAAMTPIVQELRQINSKPQLQLEQPKQDYFSLMGYCTMHKIQVSFSELKKMGMDLRKMTISKNMEIRKVPDERWGTVNSYPVIVLDEYFSE